MTARHKALLALALGALFVTGLLVLPLDRWIVRLVEWVRGAGTVGVLVYVSVYIGGALALAPASLLTLAGGFVYGPVYGTLIVWPTATVTSVVAFVLAQGTARRWIEERVRGNDKFAAIDRAIAKSGFRSVFLLRLSPVFPFVLLNYVLGLTKITLGRYALATSLGMLPGTLMYVYLGSLVTSTSELTTGRQQGGTAEQALYWAGLAATVAVTVLVTRHARRELRKELESNLDTRAAGTEHRA